MILSNFLCTAAISKMLCGGSNGFLFPSNPICIGKTRSPSSRFPPTRVPYFSYTAALLLKVVVVVGEGWSFGLVVVVV